MCQRVTCDHCEKPTFAGCGRHVEQVLGDVPKEDRCKCSEERDARRSFEGSLWKKFFGA